MSNRKGRPSLDPVQDQNQLTNLLRTRLRDYAQYTGTINSTLKDVHQLHTELDSEMKPITLVKARLDRAYDQLGEHATEEINRIDQALEALDQLMALQGAPLVPIAAAPTPPAGNKRGPYKKKNKIEAPSAAPSPLASAAPSPVPYPSSATHSPATGAIPLPRQGSSKPQYPPGYTSHASPGVSAASSIAGGPAISRKVTTKSRKDALVGQLPLQPERQVAFRLPVKGGTAESRKEEWILAKIKMCIGGDKNRYAVEDVDYDAANPTPEEGKYNTTLKSIIPLPDPRNREGTYPDRDYPPRTHVMALYPDTTSFYRAIVVSGPVTLEKGKKKETTLYNLMFEDDDEKIRPIPVELVVEIP